MPVAGSILEEEEEEELEVEVDDGLEEDDKVECNLDLKAFSLDNV